MPSVFHWVKIKTICYATEDEDLLCRTASGISGMEELDIDVSEGLHGNPVTVIDATLNKNSQYLSFFGFLDSHIVEELIDSLEQRIDEDCVFHFRIDKQDAVQGVIRLSHGGDVISVTAKVMAHPARKEVAVETVRKYLLGLPQMLQLA